MEKLKLSLYIFVAIVAISCKQKQTKVQVPPIKVSVTEVAVESLYNRINIATQIEALRNAVIQPRVAGFLLSTHYQGGMPVRRGDLLFTVDPASFATTLYAARASVESARASEVLAQRDYQRAEPLAAIDAISQSDLDQYRATYKAAKASTKSAEESLRSAELEISYTKIHAPFSGIAAKSNATRGEYIGPGTLQSELTTISQIDTISVELPIPTSRYLRSRQRGEQDSFDNSTLLSDISLTLPDSTKYEYYGEYYYTLKDTPASSSLVVVVVKFPNPDLRLKEGMFARVAANIGERQACLVVPRVAVSQMQGVNSLWVIKPDSTAQWREVTLGDLYGSKWEIESGVEAGERVVVSGGLKLHNGAKVSGRIVNM